MNTQQEQKLIEINEENPYVMIAAYGTLRKSCGNYRAILEGNSEYLGTYLTDKSYTMYGLHNGFPIVCDHGDTAIEYDLFRVTDPQVLRRVHSLEGCTGIPGHSRNWYDIQAIENEDHGTAYMYVQHQEFEKDNIIESGNWLTRHEQ